MNEIAVNVKRLYQEMASVAQQSGRDPEGVRLLAVSKTFPAASVEEAHQSGQFEFGENRVQEAETKIPLLNNPALSWHLIGPLQTNKARRATELFDVIQTVDRPKLVNRLDQCAAEVGKRLRVYIQVNLAAEPQKHGVAPEQAARLVQLIDATPHLELEGLMAIPPFEADPEAVRPYFRRLARLRLDLEQSRSSPLPGLSMGMSHDYRVAIQEGATLLRIGTAIFGKRSTR